MKRWTLPLIAALAAVSLSACAEPAPDPGPEPAVPAAQAIDTQGAPAPDAMADATFQWPEMTVYKTPYCGCCVVWIEHAEAAGIPVETVNIDDMGPTKQELGVPYGKGSCHTATIDGYFIEGHVPIDDIRRLLVERPDARGLTLPGMPAGSPGMEMPDGSAQAFTVELVARDGSTSQWAHHPAREAAR